MIERLLCLNCAQEVEVGVDDALQCCPHCGSDRIPADLTADSVDINITWHELRVLCIWAERWVGSIPPGVHRDSAFNSLRTIIDRIHLQHLDKGPLTLTGEIAQLRANGADVRLDGFTEIPPTRYD